jgi:general stress protein CsbA
MSMILVGYKRVTFEMYTALRLGAIRLAAAHLSGEILNQESHMSDVLFSK